MLKKCGIVKTFKLMMTIEPSSLAKICKRVWTLAGGDVFTKCAILDFFLTITNRKLQGKCSEVKQSMFFKLIIIEEVNMLNDLKNVKKNENIAGEFSNRASLSY